MKYKVVFKRKGEKDIFAGDAYIIDDAKNEKDARRQTRVLLKQRFSSFDLPRIAWVDEYKDEESFMNFIKRRMIS
jgi:hypothetical protein